MATMPGTNSDNPSGLPPEGLDDSREYGRQPIADLLASRGFSNHQVVEASTEQITHKMMAKACRGRFLSAKVRQKILRAVNRVAGEEFKLSDLFNYH